MSKCTPFVGLDFVFGDVPPTEAGKKSRSVFVSVLKLSGNSLYNQYVIGTRHTQFKALVNYSADRTYTRSVVFITVFSGERGKISQVAGRLRGKALKKGVMLFIFSAIKNKKF